ncbi:hypothetical protein [Litoribacter populi]|uniref:hypothetical protein n=1 Tax=Litoribacter populi TaxID=2598460 RepID=UPI0011804959|nr:hypothetical protein [Litoribacter populi]
MGKSEESKSSQAITFVRTRDEAEAQMKLGKSFEATSNVTPFNRKMLQFYMGKYNYKKTKIRRGIDYYEPIK